MWGAIHAAAHRHHPGWLPNKTRFIILAGFVLFFFLRFLIKISISGMSNGITWSKMNDSKMLRTEQKSWHWRAENSRKAKTDMSNCVFKKIAWWFANSFCLRVEKTKFLGFFISLSLVFFFLSFVIFLPKFLQTFGWLFIIYKFFFCKNTNSFVRKFLKNFFGHFSCSLRRANWFLLYF